MTEAAPPPPRQRGQFYTLRPGRLPYREALALQQQLLEQRRQGGADWLLLLEHPPVITLGRSGTADALLQPAAELTRRGVEVHSVPRGGAATFHGPGQLIGYPIVALERLERDLHRYLRLLEALLIAVLGDYGLTGRRHPAHTGVWCGPAKIAAIGVGVRRWISWHGFSLNRSAELDGFAAIVPCGLPEVPLTSLETELGHPVDPAQLERRTIDAFAKTFHSEYLGEQAPPPAPQARLA